MGCGLLGDDGTVYCTGAGFKGRGSLVSCEISLCSLWMKEHAPAVEEQHNL